MFLNWLRHSFRTPDEGSYESFVDKVNVRTPLHPVDRFVIWGWSLILAKCVLASLAIWHWEIPIGHFYIWGPSLIFGGVCTALYLTRDED